MLDGLNPDDLGKLAAMNAKQRQAFMKMYAALATRIDRQLSKFVLNTVPTP